MSISYIRYKSIILYLNNEQSFVKCTVDNGNVKCDNNLIKNDIQNKHCFKHRAEAQQNIKHLTFYILKQSYGITDHDPDNRFFESIDSLPFDLLPVYKKDDDFNEYIEKFCQLTTLDTYCYETKKFEDHDPDFTSEAKCKATVMNTITNKEFSNFNQRLYHAGSHRNLSRHGTMMVKSLFNYGNQGNVSEDGIINTIMYMFDYLKRGILVGIKNNKIALFLPFSKHDYSNDYFEELYFDNNDKQKLLQYKRNPKDKKLKYQLENTVKHYFKVHRISPKGVIWDRSKWFSNDCFFRYDTWEGDKLQLQYLDMLKDICEHRQINDCIFMLNVRDFPILRKDRKHPYTHLVNKSIPEQYKKDFCPIFSLGTSKYYDDIPLITQDDWRIVSKKMYPEKCTNEYIFNNIEPVKWEDKIEKAIFRGAASGCGITVSNNMRLKAVELSKQYPDIVDAGLTSFNRRIKKIRNGKIDSINVNLLERKEFMNYNEKLKYKYILNIDGHITAFRLGHELQMNSVILLVESHYYIWFMPELKPFVHYVPVNCDLSDLLEKIQWCKDNDEKCKQIVENANAFYSKYITLDGVYDYMASKLNSIQLYKPIEPKKPKIAIIACYRDNDKHSRYIEMITYKYVMSKMLINANIDFKIIVVEQNKKDKFSISKLKNAGFKYISEKEDFDNYIFTDIDMIPDHNLLKYFTVITDGFNSIAGNGTRYNTDDGVFFGGCISCTKEVFQSVNGYSNLYIRGWGGEDSNLHLRALNNNIINYIPDEGNIIDIEENDGYVKTAEQKLSEIKNSDNYDNMKYEMDMKWSLFREDGLSNLMYKLEYENISGNFYHIIIDLMNEEHMKKYSHHFDVSDFTMEKYEKHRKQNKEKKFVIKKMSVFGSKK